MVSDIFSLLFGLVIILFAAEFFTNGVEAFGMYFSFSQAVVGSIFAAVGTALPETILPIVAIFMYGGDAAKKIGVGAILGAPFMLSTLAFFLVGLTVSIAAFKKKRAFELKVEAHSIKRDLLFFLAIYSPAIILPLAFGRRFFVAISCVLVAGYMLYVYMTFRGESGILGIVREMYFCRMLSRVRGKASSQAAPLYLILFQIMTALLVMIKGAHIFVRSLEHIAITFGMDPLLFALLVAPVATELPEKFNSVTWTWKGKDTLALGNITGAMVFQATFPVSIGLLFTEWNIAGMALYSALIAIVSSIAVLGAIFIKKGVSPFVMLFGGVFYLIYALVLIFR